MCHKPNIANWVIENEAAEWLCCSCHSAHGGSTQRRKKTLPQQFKPVEPYSAKLPTSSRQLPYDVSQCPPSRARARRVTSSSRDSASRQRVSFRHLTFCSLKI